MKKGNSKVVLAGLMALLLSGCVMALQPAPPLPDFTKLEAGDVVLTFSGSADSWLLALSASPAPDRLIIPYSHVEALYRNKEGQLMLGGVSRGRVRASRFEGVVKRLEHMAVFRADLPKAQRGRVAKILEGWVNDPRIQAAGFDYSFQDVPGRRNKFSCLGIINEAYRASGIEAPFIARPWTPNAVGRHLQKLLGVKLDKITAPESIFSNPRFYRVIRWQNANVDATKAGMRGAMLRMVLAWYEQGWRLRSADGFHLGLLLADLPDEVNQMARTRSQLRVFTLDVFKTWERMKRRGKTKNLNLKQRRVLLEAICIKYRGTYFIFDSGDDTAGDRVRRAEASSPG